MLIAGYLDLNTSLAHIEPECKETDSKRLGVKATPLVPALGKEVGGPGV